MKSGLSHKTREVLESISRDRTRTNLLRNMEQRTIAWLVQRIPSWVTSDMLTGFGFFGGLVIFASFYLATHVSRNYLLFGVLGFAINWFGDSLDGRLAFYRNKPRKLYGFTLDITIDWLMIILVGAGYVVYAEDFWELFGYALVVMYGWEMIIALMRLRITGQYSIDSGLFGPTEVRIILSALMVAEVIVKGSIDYTALAACVIMLVFNILDTRNLLKIADKLDQEEKKRKSE